MAAGLFGVFICLFGIWYLGSPIKGRPQDTKTQALILYAARQTRSIVKGVFQRCGYRPGAKRKKQPFILQGLPGVGSERAARLLDAFGSVEAVMTATGQQLQSVEGIGRQIAEKIRWAVSEQIQPYESIDEFPI
ncbi:MAG: helix-hairpin-helix domain-containing protein [Desulfobacterales bacterium]